jgi:hypothetical protein
MGKEEAATPTETPSARCPYIESMAKNSFVALFHHLFFTVMSDQSVEASRIRPLYEVRLLRVAVCTD